MTKKITCSISALFIAIFCVCEHNSGNPVASDQDNPSEEKILQVESSIVTDTGDVTISFCDSVLLTIPQGTSSVPITATIKEVTNIPFPTEVNAGLIYDVSLSCSTLFSPPLKFTFPYDPSKVENVDSLKPVFYNESKEKWETYPVFAVDRATNTISFETDHLTPVGYFEFITNGGYPHKFVKDSVTVYYTYDSIHEPMSYSDYAPIETSWHLPTTDTNWAPEYVQDIVHYINEARTLFAQHPDSLEITKGNINIYVKNLGGSDGEYGSVSGAIYIKNTVKLPTKISTLTNQDVLKSNCAHELLHLIQDNYYVMNKGNFGLWWLEATATQAGRMLWGDDIEYSESELFSIDYNNVLLENLSKPWDDCSSDPAWYLAGCFLQYLSTYREGTKLSIAKAIKQGGSGSDIMRVMLNKIIVEDLGTSITSEYEDYVLYLFTEGNEKLTAFPHNKAFNDIVVSPITTHVQMSAKNNKQSVDVTIPYMSTKLVCVSNMENIDTLCYYDYQRDLSISAYQCEVDDVNGKLIPIGTPIYEDAVGSFNLNARVGGNMGNFVFLLINEDLSSLTPRTVKFQFELAPDFKDFDFLQMDFDGDEESFSYTNGTKENSWSIGNIRWKGVEDSTCTFENKSFIGNKIKLTMKQSEDLINSAIDGYFSDFTKVSTVTGEYSISEFVVINIKEVITGKRNEWSDEKDSNIVYTYTITKELEYGPIPFKFVDKEQLQSLGYEDNGQVYTYIEVENSKIKERIKKISETVVISDEYGRDSTYSLNPIDWNSLPSYFTASMATTKL